MARKNVSGLFPIVIVLVALEKESHSLYNKQEKDTGDKSVYGKKAKCLFKRKIGMSMEEQIQNQQQDETGIESVQKALNISRIIKQLQFLLHSTNS